MAFRFEYTYVLDFMSLTTEAETFFNKAAAQRDGGSNYLAGIYQTLAATASAEARIARNNYIEATKGE